MHVLKEMIKVENDFIHMRLPRKCRGKIVSVTIDLGNDVEKKMMLNKIKIDTTQWKFTRDEIYAES